MCTETLIDQGAEAKVFKGSFLGIPCIIKERFLKKYRHPMLDETLTHQRLVTEVRAMVRARKYGVECPALYFVDPVKHKIYMEYITGVTLDKFLNEAVTRRSVSKEHVFEGTLSTHCNKCPSKEHLTCSSLSQMAKKIGQSLAKLHNSGCIHGDITPCNILIRFPETEFENGIDAKSMELLTVYIDFGLSFMSSMAENRAVDLYVLERALKTYMKAFPVFTRVLLEEGYFPHVSQSQAVREKLVEGKKIEIKKKRNIYNTF
ncbi:EKC/KEOPS complex subunit TP53RK-like isoform X2 [Hylaeus volcanicus]|uniref:EKC/KEOPS complex subunit TP53RK-like isoform X2 n=1 Tax=Hylaeus volcanicus TaxID=313075 RepID=UPI0023B7E787|nr:EKC/KEOPS complex subunit TP53RK-like isoform X2 [Hylaeus volcanicus]